MVIVFIPIGLIVRLVICCIDACYQKAAERRARGEAEQLIAAEQERAASTTVTVESTAPSGNASATPSPSASTALLCTWSENSEQDGSR